mmetsp:Transcript_10464/g.22722  ORF Transcript_10464/g.22722 Transcript_10464/m.22722 type:complete len:660 (-) Transcript_10464:87-2066(-)|eukprot:CAMPEP_0178495634 /NCGR_PEP_ID=MMETSP0696-20121128/13655_1 /TAXON_ID=265572 /ORGANISM="Extubocellulus spinifer, Strain CCMP396" /LENGTH=659 /DNA_ID=CAMNT_0020123797 /DNA_START=264 /DNA_END=2243 /DNA_ORIENTATION=+
MMNRTVRLGIALGSQTHASSVSTKGETPHSSSASSSLRRSGDKVKDWVNGVAGRLQVAVRICHEQEIGEGERRRHVFIEIEKCVGLRGTGPLSVFRNKSSRSVAPFFILLLNGKEIGRTPPVKVTDKKTCIWVDETYEFPVCDRCHTIKLQAWNMNAIDGQVERVADFLGQATIPLASIWDTAANETKELDLEITRNAPASLEQSSSSTSCCFCPTGPLHCPVADSDTHQTVDLSNLVRVKSSSRWLVKGKRRDASVYVRPEIHGANDGRYRIENPDPFRRREIREVEDEGSGGFWFSSTLCLVFAYLAVGAIGFSFCFEKLSIRDGLYLSVVTFSTVGYGDIRPVTVGGKLFSCVFALSGIGLIGVALGILGQKLIQAQVVALQMANSRKGARGREVSTADFPSQSEVAGGDGDGDGDGDGAVGGETKLGSVQSIHVASHSASRQLLLSLFPVLVMILLGSLVVGISEGWNWVDSIYFCVITGTSVGYGDLYPSSNEMRWFSVVYIPLAVGAFSAALGRIANIFVEKEIQKSNRKLLEREVTVEDLERMNADGDGEVSPLEFVEYMLKAMNKVDQALLEDLHSQFQKLDADGSGGLESDDLVLLTEQKLNERRRVILEKYRSALLTRQGPTYGRISAQLEEPEAEPEPVVNLPANNGS